MIQRREFIAGLGSAAAWPMVGEIPIVAALAYVPPPRFRALALFGRRPPQSVAGVVGAGVRKPAQNRPPALQKKIGSRPDMQPRPR
jgi:hypothetical protein